MILNKINVTLESRRFMQQQNYTSKLDNIYKDTKMRTLQHIEKLKQAKEGGIVESDHIFQYVQHTIDCLQLCIENLPRESETRGRYARYKDELGELGDEVVKLTNPNRW